VHLRHAVQLLRPLVLVLLRLLGLLGRMAHDLLALHPRVPAELLLLLADQP
jgi:hypothetical protein